MKRKSPTESTVDNATEEDLKPQLKRLRSNNTKTTPHSTKALNSNDTERSLNRTKDNTLDTSVDRFLDSLVQSEKTDYTLAKENLMNVEETKVCKNLNETYKERDNNLSVAAEGSVKVNLQGLKDLKDVRKLAKMNKFDETSSEANNAFHSKISKKLGITFNLSKGSTLIQKKPGKEKPSVQLKKPASEQVNAKTEHNTGENPKEISMISEISTLQTDTTIDGINQLECLVASFEMEKDHMAVPAPKMATRRNPQENKWLKRREPENLANKENIKTNPLNLDRLTAFSRASRKDTTLLGNTAKSNTKSPMSTNSTNVNAKNRASSVNSVGVKSQKSIAEGMGCKSEPIRKFNRVNAVGTKSAGRIDRVGPKAKDVISSKLGVAQAGKKTVVSKEKDKLGEIMEENVKLKKDITKQTHELGEIKKENDELAKKLEALENEKLNLLREVQEKENNLTLREMEIEGIRKQLVLCIIFVNSPMTSDS